MDDAEILAKIDSLSEFELRVWGLYALGWHNTRIAHRLTRGKNIVTEIDVKQCMARLRASFGVGGIRLGLLYIDHALAGDVLPDYEPGEKLQTWRKRAELRRKQLLTAQKIRPNELKLMMLLANPLTADLGDDELAKLLTSPGRNKPLSDDSVQYYLRKIAKALNVPVSRMHFAAISWLAPLDAEQVN